ncbi:SH3 and cysteine-rich domain-containing protein isoform X2 [Scleropages formosus]|uniref:SH3 and cysteine rich domain n=1 Tax=Scleropages formosus TaxID=113540 RepID=A0A8C9TNQ8_SCLFO|nr:SH3 and cysteine-rich domain-containing protein-like isoform X2 [Scleropages formosus]
MIPPGSVIQDPERAGKENEAEQRGTPQSPGSGGQHESKLQRLKRSLSFKAKSLRSKSADNFFQRASGDVRLQVDLLPEVSPGGLGPAPLPVPGCSPGRLPRPPEGAAHSFLEHIFKKPTFCDICNHMIVGTTAKHGLRCKACKMSIHHKCMDGVGQQRCMGKLPKGFRRYYSSPLLIQEQFGCIKEVMPIACGSKVDPVYEALRFGTSLAQKTKRTSVGSGSESPHRSSTNDLAEVPEEGGSHSSRAELSRKHSDNVFVALENGTEHLHVGEGSRDESPTWAQDRTGRTLQRGLVDELRGRRGQPRRSRAGGRRTEEGLRAL